MLISVDIAAATEKCSADCKIGWIGDHAFETRKRVLDSVVKGLFHVCLKCTINWFDSLN